jgi:hypothetical protein
MIRAKLLLLPVLTASMVRVERNESTVGLYDVTLHQAGCPKDIISALLDLCDLLLLVSTVEFI